MTTVRSAPESDSDHPAINILPFPAHRVAQSQSIELRALVEETVDMLAQQLRAQRIHVDIDVPAGQRLWSDDRTLRRCVWHLALNALDAMPKGGELTITSYSGPRGLELEIADTGRGLSSEFQQCLADASRDTPANLGQALATAVRLARSAGGGLTARNCPEGGAAFTIRLPNEAVRAAA
jgi:signal transduction histidine kinase